MEYRCVEFHFWIRKKFPVEIRLHHTILMVSFKTFSVKNKRNLSLTQCVLNDKRKKNVLCNYLSCQMWHSRKISYQHID